MNQLITTRQFYDAIITPFTVLTNPEFIPKKHTVMSYAHQRRLAKKRRNIRKRLPK